MVWKIGNDNHVFIASSVMNDQFYSFIRAIYELYAEGSDTHDNNIGSRKVWRRFSYDMESHKMSVETYCVLDMEGAVYKFILRRENVDDIVPILYGADPVNTTIIFPDKTEYYYIIEGKDLCYAVAKAYTEVLKKHGYYGYFMATGGDCNGLGDIIPMYMFLFIKAYGLINMEAREIQVVYEDRENNERAVGSSFEKELELMLFDM